MVIDEQDPLWIELARRLAVRVEEMKQQLCGELTEQQTSRIRGGIRALVEVMDWPKSDVKSKPEQGIDFGV